MDDKTKDDKLWALVDDVEEIEPSANYESQFWTKLAEREIEKKSFLDQVRSVLAQKQLRYALSSLCVILVVGLFALRQSPQGVQQPVEMVAVVQKPVESPELKMSEQYLDAILAINVIKQKEEEYVSEQMELIENLEFLEYLEALENSGELSGGFMRKAVG